MGMRLVSAAAAGLAVAFAIAGLASASNQSIAAYSYTAWNPADVTIQAGENVTWSNGTGFAHNVCVAAAGATSGCGEFRSGDASDTWPSGGFTHGFASAGSYKYICENHPNMTGTVTVQAAFTGTGTSTTPPPDTMPTDTITVPTTTDTAPAADTAAPAFTAKPKRRSSRKALVLELGSSEAGTLKATVFRRPPRAHHYSRISEASLKVRQGRNVVTLPRKVALRSGSYRVKLQLIDAAGNKSPTRALTFKLA